MNQQVEQTPKEAIVKNKILSLNETKV